MIGIEIEYILKRKEGSIVSSWLEIDDIASHLEKTFRGYDLVCFSGEPAYGSLPPRLEVKTCRPIRLDEVDKFIEELREVLNYMREKLGVEPVIKPNEWSGSIHITIDRGENVDEELYSELVKSLEAVLIAVTGNPKDWAYGSKRPLVFDTLEPLKATTVGEFASSTVIQDLGSAKKLNMIAKVREEIERHGKDFTSLVRYIAKRWE